MIDYSGLYRDLAGGPLAEWPRLLQGRMHAALSPEAHGGMVRWLSLLDHLPSTRPGAVHLNRDCITVETEASETERVHLSELLQGLHPWRKGPFCLHGLRVDAEWRSNLKWDRLKDAIASLDGRLVLDVGCGNGYYALRMLGTGARSVLGIDPSPRLVCQFEAVRHFTGELPAHVLPLALEDLPEAPGAFDTVFSMGVLYHRRSPFAHLQRLRTYLRSGGELVLETLVIDGGEGSVLVPEGRYAQMRNVWFIPSPATLESWLRRCGFRRVRTLDVTPTSTDEQRSTEWMRFHSLADFLDPADPGRTVEGLPAPIRAIVLAQSP